MDPELRAQLETMVIVKDERIAELEEFNVGQIEIISKYITQLQKAKDLIHHAADEHERLKGELAKYEELNKVHINSITKLLGEKGCELSAESLACEINCLNQVEYLERALTAEAQLAEIMTPAQKLLILRATVSDLQAQLARYERLKGAVDGFWEALHNSYNVESREEIETDCEESWVNTSPLAVALHYVWKREPKVTDLQAQLAKYEWVSVEDGLPDEPTDEKGTPISVSANEGHLGTMWLFPGTNWRESFIRLCYTHWRHVTLPAPSEKPEVGK